MKISYYSCFMLLLLFFISYSCINNSGKQEFRIYEIKETFQTERNEPDNIDSPAIWHGTADEHWLIATAKKGDALVINDAATGEFIQRFDNADSAAGKLDRPNGIFTIDSLLLVVERNNHRVQVFTLPGLISLGTIGDSLLIRPYGVFAYKNERDEYIMYITDNYETENEQIPPRHELNKRIHQYKLTLVKDQLSWDLVKMFGDTTEAGMLRVVESIWGDVSNNRLLIAEEDESQTSVKVYDLDGQFTGKVFGRDLFKHQVEGIALYTCPAGSGYWIITDQDYKNNLFHVFKRDNFEHVGAFMGPKTTNTDGIWLTQTAFGNFEKGAFYAIHNDGNVSAFDWNTIADSLYLTCN